MVGISNLMISYLKRLFWPCEDNGFRPKILDGRYFFLLVIFLVGIKVLSIVSFEKFLGADIFREITQTDLYTLTNQARQANGVAILNPNVKLELAAQMKLSDMLQNNYFAHVSPSGVTPWIWIGKANYNYLVAGENLAMNFYNSNETMKAWLNSELHRKNILLPEFKDIGIAVGSGIINGQQTTVVVQEFGNPKIAQTKQAIAVIKKPTATKVPISKLTPKPTVKPTLAPTIKPSPTATSFIPTTFVLPALSRTPSSVAQVKADLSFATESNRSGTNTYSYNLFLNRIMVIMFIATIAIFMMKVFVRINIQFPELIFRATILILISAIFAKVHDSQIVGFLSGKIILP